MQDFAVGRIEHKELVPRGDERFASKKLADVSYATGLAAEFA